MGGLKTWENLDCDDSHNFICEYLWSTFSHYSDADTNVDVYNAGTYHNFIWISDVSVDGYYHTDARACDYNVNDTADVSTDADGSVVNRPTRWSLSLIFGFLW